jgi:hypothetical protein
VLIIQCGNNHTFLSLIKQNKNGENYDKYAWHKREEGEGIKLESTQLK